MPDYSNLTPDNLQKLIRIVERRTKLVETLNDIDSQIDEILGKDRSSAEVGSTSASKASVETKTKAKGKAPKEKTTRRRRGKIGELILGVLKTAGAEGERVVNIAKKIGSKQQSLHVWFGSTGKKHPNIIKLGPGRYALKEFHSSKPASSTEVTSPSVSAPSPTATPSISSPGTSSSQPQYPYSTQN